VKKVVESRGESVEAAVARALSEIGASEAEVQIEVLEQPSSGFLGLGGKEAVVRVSLPDFLERRVTEFLRGLLDHMSIESSLEVREEDDRLMIEIDGPAMGLLIGRKGETLAALRTLVATYVSRIAGQRVSVQVDVGGYMERRKEHLEGLAERIAEKVAFRGEPYTFRPMPAAERRIVHLALRDHPDVVTESQGEEPNRQLIIVPREPE